MTYLKDRFNACAATVEGAGKSHARNELSVRSLWRSLSISYLSDSRSRCSFIAQFRKDNNSKIAMLPYIQRHHDLRACIGAMYLCVRQLRV